MTETAAEGHIVTFYSYKGGTGRSMALANVAWILASNGKRVLAVDWDIEAPGLHRYFHPFLRDKNLTSTEGLMDFVVDYASETLTPPRGESRRRTGTCSMPNMPVRGVTAMAAVPEARHARFHPRGPTVGVVSATVNFFNWQHFSRSWRRRVLRSRKETCAATYDYILIDSRTGVSDTSGICTIQMPETVVLCFTLNIQSIEGAAAVAESIQRNSRLQQGEKSESCRYRPVWTDREGKGRSRADRGVAEVRSFSLAAVGTGAR